MRFLIVCALTLLPSLGFAEDDLQDLLDRYYEVRVECRIEGDAAACDELAKLGKQIIYNGYCRNHSEQEWWRCEAFD